MFRVFAFAEVEGWVDVEADTAQAASAKAADVLSEIVAEKLPEELEVRHAEWEFIEDADGKNLTDTVQKEEKK